VILGQQSGGGGDAGVAAERVRRGAQEPAGGPLVLADQAEVAAVVLAQPAGRGGT